MIHSRSIGFIAGAMGLVVAALAVVVKGLAARTREIGREQRTRRGER